MAVNEGDILRALNLDGLGTSVEKVYKDFITKAGNELIQLFKREIRERTKGSGTLAQSLSVLPKETGFEITADEYYNFVDDGVNAAPSRQGIKTIRPLIQNAPYSFKNLGVSKSMEKSISEWSGVSLGQAYGIAVSIKKHGIKPHNITDNAISDEVLEKISKDLAEVTGIMITAVFKKGESK